MNFKAERAIIPIGWVILLTVLLCFTVFRDEVAYNRRPVRLWIRDLSSDNNVTGFEAATALGKMGPSAVPCLIRALNQQEALEETLGQWLKCRLPSRMIGLLPPSRSYAAAQINAARALGEIGPGARAAIPALMDIVTGTNETYLQFESAFALHRITPVSEEAALAISRLLKADDYRFRGVIARALGDIGPAAKPAIPNLIEALADESGDLRIPAAGALWKLGETNLALASLLETLKNDSAYNRWRAAKELGEFGLPAKLAIPALTDALCDDEMEVRDAAGEALRRIDP